MLGRGDKRFKSIGSNQGRLVVQKTPHFVRGHHAAVHPVYKALKVLH
jgi:hypothetical protein